MAQIAMFTMYASDERMLTTKYLLKQVITGYFTRDRHRV